MSKASMMIAALVCVVCAACASQPQLRPAEEAERAPDEPDVVVASAEGVELQVHLEAWRWTPEDLPDMLTPVRVRIENSSERRLLLRYDGFELVTPEGMSYAALPPFDITGEATERSGSYRYGVSGFHIAPHLRHYHPHFGVAGYPFLYHDHYYRGYYPVYRRYELPTRDMLARALPEGVLDPQGRITGFVYFADLDKIKPLPERLELRFALIDAETEERFGVIDIPLRVVED